MKSVDPDRVLWINQGLQKSGPVMYWMSRDQRVENNWALLYAQEKALELNEKLLVIFTLAQDYPGANLRHFDFMIKGLAEVQADLEKYKIDLYLLKGDPVNELSQFISQNRVSLVVCDFDPLKIKRNWQNRLVETCNIPICLVDAHNIIPCWKASDKEEFSARTFRIKIKKIIHKYLTPFPGLQKMPNENYSGNLIDWTQVLANIKCDRTVHPVKNINPGSNAGNELFYDFLNNKLKDYSDLRNDPNKNATSRLSVYLHFGQISAQKVALDVLTLANQDKNTESFLEELIVRRELSDNFCYYNSKYYALGGLHSWASLTLEKHKHDVRKYSYSLKEFEHASTHEHLWNAAQKQLVQEGFIPGYMRMYWAKKILEWSESPEEALKIAIYLNDKYSLDGRDPNGYVGCLWSIGGVHDRPWVEREIFGKIRYMNLNGCMRKFDVDLYISSINQI